MRKLKAIIALSFFLFAVLAYGQENNLVTGGSLLSNNRLRMNDTMPWSWNEQRLDLQLNKKVEGYGKFNADLWFRYFNFSESDLINPYYKTNLTLPFSMEIKELNFELYDFLVSGLDVTIGRQRIAWGTGDKINPTDNLNPYDLSDIWDFGNHLGTDAIDARYYIGDFKVEGVFIPYFRPNRLPFGDWWQAFETNQNLPDTMQVVETTGIIPPITVNLVYNNFYYDYQLPVNKLSENPVYGLKVAKNLFGFDFSLSYVYGRDGFPLPSKADVNIDSLSTLFDTAYVSVTTTSIYPRIHIIGFDFAGALGNFGVRGELGIFIPKEKYELQVNSPDPDDIINLQLPLEFEVKGGLEDSVVLDNKPYARYVLGVDYTFMWNAYANFQYFHGFINERGQGNLNDYFMLHFEKKFFEDKLIISPADVLVGIYDWNDIENNYALVVMPSVKFQATDNASIKLQANIIDGKGNGLFSNIKDKDEFMLKFSYDF